MDKNYFKIVDDFFNINFKSINDIKVINEILLNEYTNDNIIYNISINLNLTIDEVERIIGRYFIADIIIRKHNIISINPDYIIHVEE